MLCEIIERTFIEELIYLSGGSVNNESDLKNLQSSNEAVKQRKFVVFVEKFKNILLNVARKRKGSATVRIPKEFETLVFEITRYSFETWVENIVSMTDVVFVEESDEHTTWQFVWNPEIEGATEVITF